MDNLKNPIKITNIIIIIIFLLIIYIPFSLSLIQDDKITSTIEKRNLTSFPPIPKYISEINQFTTAFNLYYADHFGLRELLTQAYFKIENKLTNKSTSNDVTIGQEGWMFLGSIKPGYTGYGDPMGDAINTNLYSNNELEDFSKNITKLKNWLQKQGIEYVFVIAPNKHTIYFDKLPKYITKKNKFSATDQLLVYLHNHTNIITIDLRPALYKAKIQHQLYYKTDTHWNYYGANIAQYEIMKVISKIYPGKISPYLLDFKHFKHLNFNEGDLARFIKRDNITEDNPYPVFDNACPQTNESSDAEGAMVYTTTCEKQKLTAIIFRDSFFKALQPYFSRKFKTATFIPGKINYPSLIQYIKIKKPDIVIDEIVERELPYIPSP